MSALYPDSGTSRVSTFSTSPLRSNEKRFISYPTVDRLYDMQCHALQVGCIELDYAPGLGVARALWISSP